MSFLVFMTFGVLFVSFIVSTAVAISMLVLLRKVEKHASLLDVERQRLLNEQEKLTRTHKEEILGFRRYQDQLLRRLFAKQGVPDPSPRPEDLPTEPFDPFADTDEIEEDRVTSKELDSFLA